MKTLKISLAFLFAAFLVACSTPTVSDDESEEIEQTSSSDISKKINLRSGGRIWLVHYKRFRGRLPLQVR